jgi:hypothetical protein
VKGTVQHTHDRFCVLARRRPSDRIGDYTIARISRRPARERTIGFVRI